MTAVHIRYVNLSGKPVSEVAVSDHLSPRLEYVRGSAESDREAVFLTQDTPEETVILRWELREPLPPLKDGVVRFQARVR